MKKCVLVMTFFVGLQMSVPIVNAGSYFGFYKNKFRFPVLDWKSKKTWVYVALLSTLFVGGGFGAWRFFFGGKKKDSSTGSSTKKNKTLSESSQDHILSGGDNSSSQIDSSQGGRSPQGVSRNLNNNNLQSPVSKKILSKDSDQSVSKQIKPLYNWNEFYEDMGIKFPFEDFIVGKNSFEQLTKWAQNSSRHYLVSTSRQILFEKKRERGLNSRWDSSGWDSKEVISYFSNGNAMGSSVGGNISPDESVGPKFLQKKKLRINGLEEFVVKSSKTSDGVAKESVAAVLLFMGKIAGFAEDNVLAEKLYKTVPDEYHKRLKYNEVVER